MMCFSLDYLLHRCRVGQEGAIGVTLRAESPSKRRVRSVVRTGIVFCQGFVRVSPNPCEPMTSLNGGGSTSTLLLMRAAIWSGSPGASPFLGPTIRKKLCAGI
jgi:hypothetical protein